VAVALALLSSVLWGAADFLGGTVSRRRAVGLVVGGGQAVGLAGLLVGAAAVGAFDADTGYVWWAIGAGLAGMVGLVAFYAALAAGTMGVVSPIAALGVIVPVLAGLAQGERPGAAQLVGIGIAIGGVVLASGPELSGKAGARPVALAAVAAVMFGLTLLFIAEGSDDSPLMTLVTMRIASVTVMAAVGVALWSRGRREWARLDRRDALLIAVLGVGDAAANLAFGEASTRGLVSIVGVLGSLYPVVTVLMARSFHAERLARPQVLGVVGALGGVALIAAG
jgi:drug/metabolite transporter (DMT)-like permease